MEAEKFDIDRIIQETSLEDKLRLLSGDGAWHTYGVGELPRVRMADGPCGVRLASGTTGAAAPATCFPAPSMLANSWDTALMYDVGVGLGTEATALGVNLLLAPGLNIKRHPLGGRNFEYFSEDPVLSGTLGKAFVSGVQSTGVGACVKHFAANNQEAFRMYSDSIIDERALRELYVKPFEIALEAEPAAVMTAYNKVNGSYCSQNEHLIKDILRGELGYRGITVSDWGGVHDRAAALRAGLDLEMPDSLGLSTTELNAAVANGELDEALIDKSVRRILELVDNIYLEPYGELDCDDHDRIAYNAAASSLVLLKNAGLLPLTKDKKIAVVGAYAECAPVEGNGSSHVTLPYYLSPLDAFKKRAIDINYYAGYTQDGDEQKDAELGALALRGVESADAVIFYAGLPAPSEGVDRRDMRLPANQDKLISAIAQRKHIAIVLCTSGPVEMPWVREVDSIIYAGLLGQAGALATVDAIFGRLNPCGRLAETFPIDAKDFFANADELEDTRQVYRESLFVGYKYYDATRRSVLFPFGHGLNYSSIRYDGVKLQRTETDDFVVTVTLTNESVRDGYELVQVYVSDNTGRVLSPVKQLAAFQKVYVEGKTSVNTVLHIDKRAFSFYSPERKSRCITSGEHKIIVAASALDIKCEIPVNLSGSFADTVPAPPAYSCPMRANITDSDFEALYGKELPQPRAAAKKGEFTLDNCLDDIKKSFVGKAAIRAALKNAGEYGAQGTPAYDAYVASVMHTPLYAVAAMSDGALSLDAAQGLVEMANGKLFGGLKLMIKSKYNK